MFATLIAVVLTLVLGHVAPAAVARARRYDWFDHWLAMLADRFAGNAFWQGRGGVLLALLPLLLVVVLQWGLHLQDMGFFGFLLGVAVVAYAWGPRDLDVDVETVLDAAEPAARRAAAQRLGAAAGSDGGALVDAVFVGALRRWFGVLFWFVVLGPTGALLYRLVCLCSHEMAERLPAQALQGARLLRSVLEWPVVQLLSLSLALVGDFDAAWAAWRRTGWGQLHAEAEGLRAAGRASVKFELAEELDDYQAEGMVPLLRDLPELRDAMSLVWRMLLLWLAVLALFVIAGWVG